MSLDLEEGIELEGIGSILELVQELGFIESDDLRRIRESAELKGFDESWPEYFEQAIPQVQELALSGAPLEHIVLPLMKILMLREDEARCRNELNDFFDHLDNLVSARPQDFAPLRDTILRLAVELLS